MSSQTKKSVNVESFSDFFRGWMVRQEQYLHELLSAQHRIPESGDEERRELISRVLCHYGQYLEEKSKIAQHDIFLAFNPTWFTLSEKAHFWVGGFNPGLVFRLASASVDDLSEEQRQMINALARETQREERDINDELAKIQESVAAPPLIEMAKRKGRKFLNGEEAEDEEQEEEEGGGLEKLIKTRLETLLENADGLRASIVLRMLEILKPTQIVKFLAAVAHLHLKLRAGV